MENLELFYKKITINTFILINEINDFELIDKLILDVKEGVKTSTVSRKTNVTGEQTEFNYLIQNQNFHKFLKLIQPSISKIYQQILVLQFVYHTSWNTFSPILRSMSFSYQ